MSYDARHRVYAAINYERTAQDKQWGGSAHDDDHSVDDWCDYIEKQVTLIRQSSAGTDPDHRFVKIAALAVAYLESQERWPSRKSAGRPGEER